MAEFIPRNGVDYGWCLPFAIDEFNALDKAYDLLDARGAAGITYLSSICSLFAAASVAAVASGQLPSFVALVAIIPIAAAVKSLDCSVRAQRTCQTLRAGCESAMLYAERDPEEESIQKAGFAAQWIYVSAVLRETVESKAELVDLSRLWMFRAVYLLAVPLLAAVGYKHFADPPAPTKMSFDQPFKIEIQEARTRPFTPFDP